MVAACAAGNPYIFVRKRKPLNSPVLNRVRSCAVQAALLSGPIGDVHVTRSLHCSEPVRVGRKAGRDRARRFQDALKNGRDQPARTDLRSLFKGVLAEHMGASALNGVVFPDSGSVQAMKGLIRA